MSSVKDDYVRIMQDFLQQIMPASEFVTRYLAMFKNEIRDLDEDEFEILDEVFGDVDSYTIDADLLAEDPCFYLNDRQLREKVAVAIKKLT
jgi:hypothetical protein